jgi:DNA adenine methylase
MLVVNDHTEIRQVFEGFRLEQLSTRYSNTNQRLGKAGVSGELAIMNW